MNCHLLAKRSLSSKHTTSRIAAGSVHVIRGGRTRFSRRSALVAIAAATLSGCRNEVDSPSESAESTSSVPLRIGIYDPLASSTGDVSEAEAIGESLSRAWSLASEQPLEIVALDVPTEAFDAKYDSDQVSDLFEQQAIGVDILVLPQTLLGTCAKFGCTASLSDQVLKSFEDDFGKLYPAVRNGLGIFGSKAIGVAGGAKAFAFLSSDPEAICQDWNAYHDWVVQNEGLAAEPLAEGWAATSFLHRCASTLERNWLFDRKTVKPLLDTEDYHGVLRQMLETASRYAGDQPLDPAAIWKALRSGRLRGGIGYEVSTVENEIASETTEPLDIAVSDSPAATPPSQIWFPSQTMIMALSSGCRQTDASKRLIGWMSGGEQVESFYRGSESFSPTRKASSVAGSQSSNRLTSNYMRWLDGRLQAVQVRTPLTIPGANLYRAVLDEEVRACLAGEKEPGIALRDASERWDSITESIGRENQVVAWKRAQGFGGGLY
ncbi:MAG: hypothetical protein AAF802_05325 [Planctomycetota bacterium]